MLPSVSAGSAALTKYALASATAPHAPARDPETPARPDRTAAHRPDERPQQAPADGTLVRESRAAVTALLELLYRRVHDSLADFGVDAETADRAAMRAVAELAATIGRESVHAARLVQAVLDRMDLRDSAVTAPPLLHIAARGLTIVIDRGNGTIDVTLPAVEIQTNGAAGAVSRPELPHHLLDFTDADARQAAPAIAALSAVQAAASDAGRLAAAGTFAPPQGGPQSSTRSSATVVAPNAFAAPVAARLAQLLPGTPATADVGSTVSRVIAAAVTAALPAGDGPSVKSAVDAIASLNRIDAAPGQSRGRLLFASGDLRIGLQPADGAVTVAVGKRIVAVAPASLPANSLFSGTPPVLDAASLPVKDISPTLPVGRVLDRPVGVPFVPPEIGSIPAAPPATPAETHRAPAASGHAPAQSDDAFRLLDRGAARNAVILRGVDVAMRPETGASVARMTLDISADFGPAPTSASPTETFGKLGRTPRTPLQGEPGPVMEKGYADAAAHLIPVLPAWHAAAPLPPADARPSRRKKPPHAYGNGSADDAFTRETPRDHEGLVFSSVVFSV